MGETRQDSEAKGKPPEERKPESAPMRRWLGVILLALVLIALYFVPNLAGVDPFRSWLMSSVCKSYPVKATAKSISAGWFSPIELSEVEVTDPQDKVLLEADRVVLRSSLAKILWNRRQLGPIELQHPVLHMTFTQDSSNWARVVEKTLEEEGEPEPFETSIRISNGAVVVEDLITEFTDTISAVSGGIEYRQGVADPIEFDVTASTGTLLKTTGTMRVRGQWLASRPAEGANAGGLSDVTLSLTETPLELLTPLLRQANIAQAIGGRLNGDVAVHREKSNGPLKIQIKSLRGEQLLITGSPYLAEPQVRLVEARLQGALAFDEREMRWEDLDFRSELGDVESTGGVAYSELSRGEIAEALLPYSHRVEATLNLVAVADRLPRTIRLRPGVLVNSGAARVSLVTEQEHEQTKFQGQTSWDDLSVITDGDLRTLPPAWIVFEAARGERGLVVESLEGKGDFFTLEGEGGIEKGSLSAEFNLDQLSEQLSSVIDVQGIAMAGTARLAAEWVREGQDDWNATASGGMSAWELTLPDGNVWTEDDLRVEATVRGQLRERRLQRLMEGRLVLTAGEDRSTVRLAGPVDSDSELAEWPVAFDLEGELGSWRERLATVIRLPEVQAAGQFKASGQVRMSEGSVSWEQLRAVVEPLALESASFAFHEPSVKLSSSRGGYSSATGLLQVEDFQLTSASLALHAAAMQADWNAAIPVVTGVVGCRGDWKRLGESLDLYPADKSPDTWRMEGDFEGEIKLSADGEQADGAISLVSTDTALLRRVTRTADDAATEDTAKEDADGLRWKQVWFDSRATLTGGVALRRADKTMELSDLLLDSSLVKLTLTGSVTDLGTSVTADLQGTAQYDLENLVAFVQPELGENFELVGRETTEFFVRGPLRQAAADGSAPGEATEPWGEGRPLVPLKLAAGGGLSWQKASLYGLTAEAGQVSAELDRSVVRFSPLDIPLQDGRLRANASLLLFEPRAVLTVEEGRIVDDVEITPAMCRAWLKYVAPLMADVTRIRGRLSVDLSASRVALADPGESNVSGLLGLDQAQVGPGPVSQATLRIAEQVQQVFLQEPMAAVSGDQDTVWLDASQQQVPFSVREGRVFHKDMRVSVGSVVVITSGSVGLDQSLALQAEIPIRKQWFGEQETLLSSLAGQSLRIPITGTLAEPDIDRQVLQDLTAETARSAAGSLLQEGLRQGVRSLFDFGFGSEEAKKSE